MIVASLERGFGYSGPLADICLLTILIYKRRWQTLPAFTSLIALDLVSTLAIELAYGSASRSSFRAIYISVQVLSVLLQLAVLVELAKVVLKPTGIWARGARRVFFLVSILGASLALAACFLLSPQGVHGVVLMQLRGDIFTGLLTCEIVVAMMVAASEVGLAWKSHVMAVGQGLMFWALLTVTTEGLDAFLDPAGSSINAYYLRGLIYLVTVTYWTVALWREEPARRPISPLLQKYVVALHDRVQYDLGKAGH